MLRVKGLTKVYEKFTLKDVSFSLEPGYIMGFIGANGAGKSTTLKGIMNIIKTDGEVEIFGKDMKTHEIEIKKEIGFLLGAVNQYPLLKVKKYLDTTASFYDNWDEVACKEYLDRFSIDGNKRIKDLSQGMKVKLGLTVALSHNAKLFLLDEPTSGLDPLARDEILDILVSLVSDGERSVLFSTHITSDLEKIADYILFIKNGLIVANDTKDALLDNYLVVHGSVEQYGDIADKCIGSKVNKFSFSALMKAEDRVDGYEYERPSLEDITVYYGREK